MLHTERVSQSTPEHIVYRERLFPGSPWWAVAVGLVVMVAIAYGAALGMVAGVLTGAGLAGIVIVAMLRTSPVIRVSDRAVSCGTAHLPTGAWAQPQALGRDAVIAVRRGHESSVGDRVYVVMPAWMSGSGVLIRLHDETDPHSAWLIGTRDPEGLMRALQGGIRTP